MLQSSRSLHSTVPISCSTVFSPLRTVRCRGHRSASLPLPFPSERRPTFCQAEAPSPNEPSTAEGVLDYALGQGVYQFVAAALGVLSISFLFAAPAVCEKMYGLSLLPVAELLIRDSGAAMFVPLAMSLSLQSAVESNRMDSPTYQRMSFTLALIFLGVFALKMVYISKDLIAGASGFWITSVVQVLPAVAFLKLYGFSTMPDIVPGFISGVTSLFEPDNINSALYSLFAIVTMIISLGSILKPSVVAAWFSPLTLGAFTTYVMQQLGGAMFLLSIACFSLKDSADRDRLGFTTFRNLNIGVFLTSIGKIGATLFVNNKVVDAAAAAAAAKGAKNAVEAAPDLLTKNGFIALIVIFGGLALLSGYNAITATKD